MVNARTGMGTGAVGTHSRHEDGGWGVGRLQGMVMPNLSLKEYSRNRRQHVARARGPRNYSQLRLGAQILGMPEGTRKGAH